MANNITDADAVIVLTIPLLLPVPTTLNNFAVDDIFDVENVAPTEIQMGADGVMTMGWVPREKKMTIMLNAASTSNIFFDAWAQGQDAASTAFAAGGVITLPSLGMIWIGVNGALTGYKPTPGAKKVAQPRRFEITWNTLLGAPVGSAG